MSKSIKVIEYKSGFNKNNKPVSMFSSDCVAVMATGKLSWELDNCGVISYGIGRKPVSSFDIAVEIAKKYAVVTESYFQYTEDEFQIDNSLREKIRTHTDAEAIKTNGNFVMAMRSHCLHPYVIWQFKESTGECFWGEYIKSRTEADYSWYRKMEHMTNTIEINKEKENA